MEDEKTLAKKNNRYFAKIEQWRDEHRSPKVEAP